MTTRKNKPAAGQRCWECDAPATEAHHVVPKSLGGTRTIPLCDPCHDKAHCLSRKDGRAQLTKIALAHKRAQGRRTSKDAPIGWRVGADGDTLERDEGEQTALAQIHALRADGVSIRAIADHLTAAGVPARGGRWHKTTIAKLVRVA